MELLAASSQLGVRLSCPELNLHLGPLKVGVADDSGSQLETVRFDHTGRETTGHLSSGLRAVLEVSPTNQRSGIMQAGYRVTFHNGTTSPIQIDRLVLGRADAFSLGPNSSQVRVFRNGFQSWSGTRTKKLGEADRDMWPRIARVATNDPKHRSPKESGTLRSDSLCALYDPQSRVTLVVGVAEQDLAFHYVELSRIRGSLELTIWSDLDGIALNPGEVLGFTVLFAFGPPSSDGIEGGPAEQAWAAMSELVRAVGKVGGARVSAPLNGWCSWYQHFEKVTEQDVLASLKVLAKDGRNGPIFDADYVMIDDGYQAANGDWLRANSKFPRAMAALAQDIVGAGFDAGIWTAPFLAAPDSLVAKHHPDWLVRKPNQKPVTAILNPAWGITKPQRVLDTTHPEVLEHLESTFATIVREWGYRILKLDFLYAASIPGTRHNPGLTRAAALHEGLQAIRRGAGEDAYLIGCGCPMGPALGVVDAMRIGPDVTPYWNHALGKTFGRREHGLATEHAIYNILSRSIFDSLWWTNDPDCLMVRDQDTRLTLEEVRCLATAIGITNGMLVYSDALDKLPAERIAMISTARSLQGGELYAPRFLAEATAQTLVSIHQDRVDLAFFNLADQTRSASIVPSDLPPLASLSLPGDGVEVWTGKSVTARGSRYGPIEVPPHSARVIRLALGT